jgi:cell surface protein SprA
LGLARRVAIFTDQYAQGNNLTLRTNRQLWTGVTIDLNWKIGWQFSRSVTVGTDALGHQTLGAPQTSGNIERSYLTIPPVLFFKVFKSNLETVGKKYQQYVLTNSPDVALAKSFEEGLEALPFLGNVIGQYVPRPNWSLRWDGIEKLVGLTSIMDRLSLEHNYTSTFRRDFRSNTSGGQKTDAERMNYGYTPLVGLTMGFKQVLKGNLSGNFRYNSTKNYELNLAASSPNIVSALSQEMALTLTFARHGFSFPLFGLNLSNDVDISATYSRTTTARRRYDPALLTSDQEGTPLDGNTRTSLEPRIRYVLSSRVTAAIYYKYSKTQPDAGGSSIYGLTTNEAGVDIHISI